jgi:hypothetical protein
LEQGRGAGDRGNQESSGAVNDLLIGPGVNQRAKTRYREIAMSKKPTKVMSLAAALAALPGVASLLSPVASAKPVDPGTPLSTRGNQSEDARPNVLMAVGKDLLGMIVKKGGNGIVTADHYSHASHASHESHASHYSGR